MTKKEMTELFSVMLLAWPNAEMFKGGIQKLGPTIELWSACTTEVDFWTAQQAVIKLCRECKFPPTIAEFREKVEAVESEIQSRMSGVWNEIRWESHRGLSNQEIYARFPIGGLERMAIDAIGGPENLSVELSGGGSMWNITEWERAYKKLLRQSTALSIGGRGGTKQLGGKST